MAASKEDAKIVTTNSTDSELNPTTTTTRIDPWMLFLYALKAPATKEK